MRVRFEKNGFETEMRDEVGKVYIAKGKVKKVVEKQEKPAPRPSRPEPKKQGTKEDE